ncbi:MAG: septum formation initiator family protein [Clostridia bacterium]|nr:septum formation initiator family protein [Clostridia bacterium]
MYGEAMRTETQARTNTNNSQLRTRNRDSIFDSELDYSGSAKRSKARSYLSEMVDPCKTVEADGTRYLNVEAPRNARVATARTADASAVREKARTESIPSVKATTREEATRLRNAKASFPIATVTLTIICTLLAMIMVYSFTQKHETSAELASLQETLDQLSTENKELSLSLEEKDNLALIEQIARNEYGMVGEEELQKRYLSLSSADYVKSLEAETSNPGVFATILSAIGINFGNLWEYGQ